MEAAELQEAAPPALAPAAAPALHSAKQQAEPKQATPQEQVKAAQDAKQHFTAVRKGTICPACGAVALTEEEMTIVRKPGRRSKRDAGDPRNRPENLVTPEFLRQHIEAVGMSLRDIGYFHGYTISTLSRRAKQEGVQVGHRVKAAAAAAEAKAEQPAAEAESSGGSTVPAPAQLPPQQCPLQARKARSGGPAKGKQQLVPEKVDEQAAEEEEEDEEFEAQVRAAEAAKRPRRAAAAPPQQPQQQPVAAVVPIMHLHPPMLMPPHEAYGYVSFSAPMVPFAAAAVPEQLCHQAAEQQEVAFVVAAVQQQQQQQQQQMLFMQQLHVHAQAQAQSHVWAAQAQAAEQVQAELWQQHQQQLGRDGRWQAPHPVRHQQQPARQANGGKECLIQLQDSGQVLRLLDSDVEGSDIEAAEGLFSLAQAPPSQDPEVAVELAVGSNAEEAAPMLTPPHQASVVVTAGSDQQQQQLEATHEPGAEEQLRAAGLSEEEGQRHPGAAAAARAMVASASEQQQAVQAPKQEDQQQEWQQEGPGSAPLAASASSLQQEQQQKAAECQVNGRAAAAAGPSRPGSELGVDAGSGADGSQQQGAPHRSAPTGGAWPSGSAQKRQQPVPLSGSGVAVQAAHHVLRKAVAAFHAADTSSSKAMLRPLNWVALAGKGGSVLQEVVACWDSYPPAKQRDLFSTAVLVASREGWDLLESNLRLELHA